jgi:hypothetical protein
MLVWGSSSRAGWFNPVVAGVMGIGCFGSSWLAPSGGGEPPANGQPR